MLIILGGLPGTGKSTIAKELAKRLNAVYLRVDSIEQAIKDFNHNNNLMGPEGYVISYAIAQDNLCLGNHDIADSVNPIELTRYEWRQVAIESLCPFVEIEIFCSDAKEHRQRVESRESEISGLILPTWEEVKNRDYENWKTKSLTIDTAEYSAVESVQLILNSCKQFL
ncbi:AAA family ATPase [Legionella waltersii]|uniref:Cytidylate kinase n=1 Tax=Legionella waltersii TaxID=66969 RepID=A0A0W1A177_9GAMM|nr:AAA family ATPase [Legionella waltersii]KTD75103.1 cytidylate kinase [Legionella waltersii]SNV05092.1 cytidylate kinase [Legionella waltersii]